MGGLGISRDIRVGRAGRCDDLKKDRKNSVGMCRHEIQHYTAKVPSFLYGCVGCVGCVGYLIESII